MLSLSDVEEASVLVVDSCLSPFGVALVILDFIFPVTLAGNNHQQVLKVFGQDILLFLALENSVDVVHELLLVWRHLLLEETHLGHDGGSEVEVKHLLLWINLDFTPEDLTQSDSELSFKRLNSENIALLVLEL